MNHAATGSLIGDSSFGRKPGESFFSQTRGMSSLVAFEACFVREVVPDFEAVLHVFDLEDLRASSTAVEHFSAVSFLKPADPLISDAFVFEERSDGVSVGHESPDSALRVSMAVITWVEV